MYNTVIFHKKIDDFDFMGTLRSKILLVMLLLVVGVKVGGAGG